MPNEKVTLDVTLRDKTNDKTGVYSMSYDADYPLKTIVFMWTEGNYSCDCNRSDFLYDGEVEYECNSENIEVELAVIRETGLILCNDGEWSV